MLSCSALQLRRGALNVKCAKIMECAGRAKRRRRFGLKLALISTKAPSPLRSAGALHTLILWIWICGQRVVMLRGIVKDLTLDVEIHAPDARADCTLQLTADRDDLPRLLAGLQKPCGGGEISFRAASDPGLERVSPADHLGVSARGLG